MLNFAAQAARDCRRIESDLRAHGYRDDAATAGGLADRIAAADSTATAPAHGST